MWYRKAELPLGIEVGGELIGTSRTTEVKKMGEKYVLKEIKKVSRLKKMATETDEQYRERRLARSLEILKEEKELADIAKGFIPDEVITHPESFFIANGEDGYPTPYKVQEFIEGKILREMNPNEIQEDLKIAMDKLVLASARCFMKTGRVFDIVGCVVGDGASPIEEVVRHLNPTKYSSNVMMLNNSKLAFIDARVGGGNLLMQITSFMTLAGYYWNRLKDKTGWENRSNTKAEYEKF